MMKLQRFTICFILLLLVAAGAFAQGTTGALTGSVSQAGASLPGVTVTIASPKLQGTRTTVTNEQGDYSFSAIPPGTYKVTFSLSGLTDVVKNATVNLVETTRLDADMKMSAVAEAITVTASQTTVLETPQVQTNFKQENINRLPTARNPVAQAALAPGVTSGVNGNTISGAMSYDNLYLVNGAVVNENLRGQAHALYIEDAIQETTVLTGGISAEFGRFTGGVVSAITKSGGNEFSGSVRDTLDNPKWTAKSVAGQVDPVDHINNTYEETLGGRIVRDRLWFFVAGRQSKVTANRTLTALPGTTLPNPTLGSYVVTTNNPRQEYKLTANLTQKHSIVGSYLNNDVKADKNCQLTCIDLGTLNTHGVENPNNFKTLHYNGVITNNLLIEGDWAKKYFAFVGFGGSDPPFPTDAAGLAHGSTVRDAVSGGGGTGNAPAFCGSCGPELRNNKEWEVKGRYFLGTKSLGTHNMVVGYDDWAEQRLSNNYQSTTNYRYDVRGVAPVQQPDGSIKIALTSGVDRFNYFPVAFASLGSNLKTTSVFFNDKWDLNQHLTLNLGARYDKNDAVDSAGHGVSKDSLVSPRVGAIFDVFGNGRLRLDANYGVYSGRLAETVAGQGSAAGNPAQYVFTYGGPSTGLLNSTDALVQAFTWFLANGGINRTAIASAIPGLNAKLDPNGIKSPNMREITLGAGTQIGKGYIRADYINRNWRDFYANFTSLALGSVIGNPNTGALADLSIIGNSDVPTRKYWGMQFQGQYQLPAGFGLGGNYTYSKLTGNVEGETSGSGPVTFGSSSVAYKEFQNFAQNAPTGYLAADQRHKIRGFLTYDIGTRVGHFNLGVIERYDSGSPYSAAASITVNSVAGLTTATYPDGTPRVSTHDYAQIPTAVTYFFSKRGEFRTDSIVATDFALNYELPIRNFAFFAKGEVRNVFNHKATVGVVTTVLTNQNSAANLAAFNPFTQTPVLCTTALVTQCPKNGTTPTTNYYLGTLAGVPFGAPSGTPTTFSQNGSFQLPRTYLYAIGVRF
jgi:outer membrane receptor protein involved in Fe transport